MHTLHNKQQRGATLIVSLVILAVVTLLGVASMRSSTLQLTMSASARDRAVAFQAAESALAEVEAMLKQTPSLYNVKNFLSNCTGAPNGCFDATCSGGLCFTGRFDATDTKRDCSLANAAGQMMHPWTMEDAWEQKEGGTGEKFNTVNIARTSNPEDATARIDVQYMIEFMCYVPKDKETVVQENTGLVPLYRITVRAPGEAQRSTVMLQSTLKGAE